MRILEIDIETAPHSAFIWSLWQKFIASDHIEIPGYTLCFAASWRGEEKIEFWSCWNDGVDAMVARAWDLLNEADAVVHYNGKKFDIPMLNTEFLLMGYVPPAPFVQIDLLPVVRKNFRFPSNKLDYVCKRLGIGQKVVHRGMELWSEAMEGDKTACREMEEYNRHDVKLLGPLYEYLLPWMTQHPNHAMYTDNNDKPICTNCGSEHITAQGYRPTKTGKYRRYQCQNCGTWLQGRNTVLSREDGRNILKQIPQ